MSRTTELMQSLDNPRHGALITSDVNRRYFTGFKSSAGVVLITKEKSYLLIDFRYFEKAEQQVKECTVVLLTDLKTQLTELLLKHNITLLSVESESMTLDRFASYSDKFHHVEFDSSDWLSRRISAMRIIKDAEELNNIRAAQAIAEKAFNKLLNNIRAGVTEKQAAALLNYFMMDFGADDLSFETIAASGVNSASPHAVPTDKQLAEGDFVTFDFGAVVNSYHSDMTRTIVVGKPTEQMKEVYNAVLMANLDALKAAKPNISAKLLDSVARGTLEAWGYEKYFGHGLGHGVGLEIHEAPTVSSRGEMTLREGMVITIEPGVYLPHNFGVRIEDMIVLTENGYENLTKATKSLISI